MTDHAPKPIRARKMGVDAQNMIRRANIATDLIAQELIDKVPTPRATSIIQRDIDNATEQVKKKKAKVKALTLELSQRTNPHDSEEFTALQTYILETYGEPTPYDEDTLQYYKPDGSRTDLDI